MIPVLFMLPMVSALLTMIIALPLILWRMHLAATGPIAAPVELTSWEVVLADLDAPSVPCRAPLPCRRWVHVALSASYPLGYTPRRRRSPRNVARYAPLWACMNRANELTAVSVPPDAAPPENRGRGPPPPSGGTVGKTHLNITKNDFYLRLTHRVS